MAKEPEREWTLMFYFASDNPLAPGIVSQLKSLKNAGYVHDVNVVAQFDPQTQDTPTHIFDVNRVNKMKDKKSNIGFGGDDPYIRNLVLDKLWGSDDEDQAIKNELIQALKEGTPSINYNAPEPPSFKTEVPKDANRAANGNDAKAPPKSVELSPFDSLRSFLNFCATSYPARHYMLFLIGHGVIVGNDMFLFDADAAEESLSLMNLGTLLNEFNVTAGKDKLELLAFHSCSLSSLEVTYELQGQAKYMLASQGPAFVGSWPYREILIRIFKDTERRSADIQDTITKIFDYILFNSFDFQLAGYSFDICLSKLNDDLTPVSTALNRLCDALIAGLDDKGLAMHLILLAHWEAQSYWQEMYTDLSDFCGCLSRLCNETLASVGDNKVLKEIADSAEALNRQFIRQGFSSVDPNNTVDIDRIGSTASESSLVGESFTDIAPLANLIVRSEFAGPESQYSNGLSVYFPWSEPIDHNFWPSVYREGYKFKATKWGEFLQKYFDETMRAPVKEDDDKLPIQQRLLEKITARLFNVHGALGHVSGTLGPGDGKPGGAGPMGPGDGKPGGGNPMGPGDGKPGGSSGTGIGCDCPSIKNYPSVTRRKKDADLANSRGLRNFILFQ